MYRIGDLCRFNCPISVNTFEKMPWGYTVRFTSAFIPLRFAKRSVHLQGIFELENGGGLFGQILASC